MADFDINGADQFKALSKSLKAAGRSDLRRELNSGVKKAVRPLMKKTRDEARRRLPKRGGLAKQVAREPQRTKVRTGKDPGVRLEVGRNRGGARGANQGVIRHRVFGQDVWVEQKVPGGWFDETIKGEAPTIRRDIERSMRDLVDKIARSIGGG